MINPQNIKRFYEEEEIKSMNFLFNKNEGNNWFSRDELCFANGIDLFNLDEVLDSKNDWSNSFID